MEQANDLYDFSISRQQIPDAQQQKDKKTKLKVIYHPAFNCIFGNPYNPKSLSQCYLSMIQSSRHLNKLNNPLQKMAKDKVPVGMVHQILEESINENDHYLLFYQRQENNIKNIYKARIDQGGQQHLNQIKSLKNLLTIYKEQRQQAFIEKKQELRMKRLQEEKRIQAERLRKIEEQKNRKIEEQKARKQKLMQELEVAKKMQQLRAKQLLEQRLTAQANQRKLASIMKNVQSKANQSNYQPMITKQEQLKITNTSKQQIKEKISHPWQYLNPVSFQKRKTNVSQCSLI